MCVNRDDVRTHLINLQWDFYHCTERRKPLHAFNAHGCHDAMPYNAVNFKMKWLCKHWTGYNSYTVQSIFIDVKCFLASCGEVIYWDRKRSLGTRSIWKRISMPMQSSRKRTELFCNLKCTKAQILSRIHELLFFSKSISAKLCEHFVENKTGWVYCIQFNNFTIAESIS